MYCWWKIQRKLEIIFYKRLQPILRLTILPVQLLHPKVLRPIQCLAFQPLLHPKIPLPILCLTFLPLLHPKIQLPIRCLLIQHFHLKILETKLFNLVEKVKLLFDQDFYCTSSWKNYHKVTCYNFTFSDRLRWSNAATLLLLELWRQRRSRFENNTERNEALWEEISNKMKENGHQFSGGQIENRFKYLKKTYIECVDKNRKSTGRPEKTCSYYEELHELFHKSPQINPPNLVASRQLTNVDVATGIVMNTIINHCTH